VRRTISLDPLRLSLLAAAGLGAATCGTELLNPGGSSGSTTASASSASSATASSASSATGTASSSAGTTGGGGAGGVGGSGGGGAGGGGAGGVGGFDPICAGAQPIKATNGAPSGFSWCPDGTIHRVAAVTCDASIDAPACTGTETTVTCASDADCTAGPHGRCVAVTSLDDLGLVTNCGCNYACVDDAECGAGNVCVCGGVLPIDNDWSLCAPAACVTGADCPSGECGISAYNDGCKLGVQLACRAPTDACRSNDDCALDGGPSKRCILWGSTDWQCALPICPLGRPLIVEGAARTAPAAPRGDWEGGAAPDLGGLDARARAALARHWREAAAVEHASVASFARFTLDLLALGAPPDLVAEAQRAGLDEVEHARIAYGLAGAYAGEACGPGPLDLGALRCGADRRAILRSLIEEACVGETLGVAEALALADRARDPGIAGVYRRIAADEQRHAELAWKTLAWLTRGADAATRAFAARCFEDAVAAMGSDPPPRGPALPEHGLLAPRDLGAIRRQALREVVAPCAAALLAA
jgi:hypothetical protein